MLSKLDNSINYISKRESLVERSPGCNTYNPRMALRVENEEEGVLSLGQDKWERSIVTSCLSHGSLEARLNARL